MESYSSNLVDDEQAIYKVFLRKATEVRLRESRKVISDLAFTQLEFQNLGGFVVSKQFRVED
ncbi:hypothetical protein J1614_003903 [Plenodomus biglobosus]|nr:hypothetical protein J1614_003903 [Plenodomus biglobosus]